MTPASRIQNTLQRCFSTLVKLGKQHDGLFPSILRRADLSLDVALPLEHRGAIYGQRNGDRSYMGANLMHDLPTLRAMEAYGERTGDPTISEAVQYYLRQFSSVCETPTGLFPWGEHSFWNLKDQRVGDSYQHQHGFSPDGAYQPIHDHLRMAPEWLWDRLHTIDPKVPQRFCDGLEYHLSDPEGHDQEFLRHAGILNLERRSLKERERSCDFPRHCGFYIFDLAKAHSFHPRESTRQRLITYIDYWWNRKDPNDLCGIESYTPPDRSEWADVLNIPQTFSLGLSLLESAPFISDIEPELSALMTQRAKVFMEAIWQAPFDPEQHRYPLSICRRGERPPIFLNIWHSVYGASCAASFGALLCRAHRLTGDSRYLNMALKMGDSYRTVPFPTDVQVPAKDPGGALGLLCELYDITGESKWLDASTELGLSTIDLYTDSLSDLPKTSSGLEEIYDAQMCISYLLYNWTRLWSQLTFSSKEAWLEGDFTDR